MAEHLLTVEAGGLRISLDATALRLLIEEVVADVIERLGADDRIGFTEAEAAAKLGIPRHRLRDARLRGEIAGSKLGKCWMYSRRELLRFVDPRNPSQNGGGRRP